MNIFVDERPVGRVEGVRAVSKLTLVLRTLLRTHASLEIAGANPLMPWLTAEAGLDPWLVGFEGIIVAGRHIELAAFTRRAFDEGATKVAWFKRLAHANDLTLALVPPAVMSRQVPSWNCGAGGRELRPALCARQRMSTWLRVLENGGSTLTECAASIDHPEPVAAVLSLAIDGVITLDWDARLTSSSRISLPSLC